MILFAKPALRLAAFVGLVLLARLVTAQPVRHWTEADRQLLLDNLGRTRKEIVKETEKLSLAQWHFKESPDKWSIAQVVEHLGLYERLFDQEIRVILNTLPEPELNQTARTDSMYLAWIYEPQPHFATAASVPMGFMKGKDNLTYFLYGRDIIENFVKTTPQDLKAYFTYRGTDEKRRSLHALLVVDYAHADRHLRQIRRIKEHPDFPKKSVATAPETPTRRTVKSGDKS